MLTCPECSAPLEADRDCVSYFHELLVLEAEVAGAAGGEPHFFAVASYNLQHPSGFTPDSLSRLREAVADVIEGRAQLPEIRRRIRSAADGPVRVRQRSDLMPTVTERALLQKWPTVWKMTVRDVLAAGANGYTASVRAWARSVSAELGAAILRN